MLMPAPFEDSTRELIKQFNTINKDSIKVVVTRGPRETESVSDLAISSLLLEKSPYDALLIDVTWLPKYAEAGWLENLAPWFDKTQFDKLEKGAEQGNIYKGNLYRWPFVADIGLLYWRKDLMSKPPKTPLDLTNISKRLKVNKQIKYGYVWQGRQYEGLSCVFLEIAKGFGGDWISKEGVVALNNKNTISSIKWLKSLLKEGLSPKAVTNFSEPEALQVFKNGDAAFMRNWPYAWKELQKDTSKVKGKVGITTMVSLNNYQPSPTLGSWGFSIISSSPNKDKAAQLIKFLSSNSSQKYLFLNYGYTPTTKEVFEDKQLLAIKPILVKLRQALRNSKPRPMTPVYAQISDVLQRHLSSIITEEVDIESEMSEATKSTERILSSAGIRIE